MDLSHIMYPANLSFFLDILARCFQGSGDLITCMVWDTSIILLSNQLTDNVRI